jgi:hypothetical protein
MKKQAVMAVGDITRAANWTSKKWIEGKKQQDV